MTSKPRTIPSMFHRRLLLLAGVMGVVMLVLVGQLSRLSVVQGADRLERADLALKRNTLLPTYRGSIIDRHGRRLAVDRPGYAIAVNYDVITGDWLNKKAREHAIDDLTRSRWDAMGPPERRAALAERLPAWEAKRERLWSEIRKAGGLDALTLEANLDDIRRDVDQLAEKVWERQRRAEIRKYGADEANYVFKRRPIREQQQAHVVLARVSDELAFSFRALADELPGMFEVQDARRRDYPWLVARVPIDRRSLPEQLRSEQPIEILVEGVADHILGGMREVQAEDVERRPFVIGTDSETDLGGYRRVGDNAGSRGLERVFEDVLRGRRGLVRRRLDSERELRTEPEPGSDVSLTLDIALQARVQALLSDEVGLTTVQPYHGKESVLPPGWPLNSAAVVLEVETGEILAMVSMPTVAMGRRVAELDPARSQIDQPWVNRPAEAIYPPGSIMKPLVLASAVTQGVHRLEEPITCTGQYFPDSKRPRCWIYREQWSFATHEKQNAEEAIAHSCNIYFYTLAERLGMERLTDWYAAFGIGRSLDIGLMIESVHPDTGAIRRSGEHGGTLLSADAIAGLSARTRRYATVSMGIGQGIGVTWTPLVAANAYATLARGGLVRDATLVMDDPRGSREPSRADLDLDPRAVAAAMDGLHGALQDGGTGHHITHLDKHREPIFNAVGVTLWGKTGTAQAPPLRIDDTNGDAVIDSKDEGINGLDHAWFVGFVGPNDTRRPMFVIAVVVEYGGSGGRVAGPIANQIVHALQEEGYLPQVEFQASEDAR